MSKENTNLFTSFLTERLKSILSDYLRGYTVEKVQVLEV